jgi:homoserine kinase
MKANSRLSLFLLLAATCSLLGGCANVQPWERATMADYSMRPDRDSLMTAMSEHIYFSREASSGGRGVGGSGCGCN